MHISNCPKSLAKIIGISRVRLALGNFDGIHKGHQALLQGLVHRAQLHSEVSVVVTFLPHPAQFFRKDGGFRKIDTPSMRRRRLAQLGLGAILELPFDESLACLTGSEFLQKYIEPFRVSEISVGRDFRFGKNRSGDVNLIQIHSQKFGYEVRFIEQVKVDGEIASSSTIRKYLQNEGQVQKANQILGREFEIEGQVVHGDKIGRSIGFPTANIEIEDQIIPKNGVYCGFLMVLSEVSSELRGRDLFPCVVNIGVRPTVSPSASNVRLEAHLIDQEIDLYGETVRLQFVDRIRDEMQFESLSALKDQITKDIEIAKSNFKMNQKSQIK